MSVCEYETTLSVQTGLVWLVPVTQGTMIQPAGSTRVLLLILQQIV